MNHIVHSLTGKATLNECSVDDLRDIISKYPYFSTAHYLLSKKLIHDGNVNNGHSFIYFNNPLLVDFLLSSDQVAKPEKNNKQMLESASSLNAEQEEEYFNDEIVYPNNNRVQETVHNAAAVNVSVAGIEHKETVSEQPPVFEPYHTVDYFASQGIRPTLEEKPKDRFGQQLKSFTDWLRTMKRLPETELIKTVSISSEEKVVTLAEHSIENREVITESMAEVWIRQGQKEKAIEIYSKLSLLSPSKSAYFAGLIENLKKH